MTADRPAPALSDKDRAMIAAIWIGVTNAPTMMRAADQTYAAGLAEGIRRERERCLNCCKKRGWEQIWREKRTISISDAIAAAIRAGEPPDRAAPK